MPRFGPPGEQIGYRVYPGPVGAPPLFLLHGFTASSASFLSNIEPLSEHFTVVTIDLLGHGESDAPVDPRPYGPEVAVARIVGIADALGYERVMLCGHSLGGALALRAALDAPERVAAVAVINSNSAAGGPEWRQRALPSLRQMAHRVRTEGTGFLRDTALYPAAGKRLPGDVRDQLMRDFDALAPAGVAGTAEALTVQVNAFERLPELNAPLLVVIGDRDQAFVRNSFDFLEQLPAETTSWVTLEGAGHAANLEQPREFEAALIAFAEDIGYLSPAPVDGGNGGQRGSAALAVLGGAMVVAGAILVAGAFLVGGDDDGSRPAEAEIAASATETPVETSAGVRTPGPAFTAAAPSASPVMPTATEPAPSPDAAVATPPPPTGAPSPPTEQPVVAAPAATPTEERSPTATATAAPSPTPEGPFASISGPSSAAVGDQATFVASYSPGELKIEWANCQPGLPNSSCTRYFDIPGCEAITLTVYYPPPEEPRSATRVVTVGEGTTCE